MARKNKMSKEKIEYKETNGIPICPHFQIEMILLIIGNV